MLLPVIGLVQVGRQALADRYSYLPHIGLFVALVWLAVDLIPNRRALAALGIASILALTGRSIDQVRHWRDTDTLFTHALAVTPENAVTLNQVGNAHARRNDLPGAERLYQKALELEPDYGMAHLNLGNLLVRRRDFAPAAEHFEAARRWRWELPRAQLGLAIARSGLRQYDRADEAFALALKQSPWMADAELAWGLSFRERGDLEHAKEHLRAALALNPNLELARRVLAEIDAANPAISPATRAAPQR
jgi:tetratricopeptide (TPR) repeat protein